MSAAGASGGRAKRTRQRAATRVMPALGKEALNTIAEVTGHRFSDETLIVRAMTHSSAALLPQVRSNQRLEFLGDRVLGLVIAETLMERFADEKEGGLARRLNALVRRETCAEVAGRAALADHLILGPSERANGAATLESVKADLCEAVIAAIYLDGGLKAARGFILKFWERHLRGLGERRIDPKTQLQLVAQSMGLPRPHYELVGRDGPDHKPVFRVRVQLDGHGTAEGEGMNKQDAEMAAAEALAAAHDLKVRE